MHEHQDRYLWRLEIGKLLPIPMVFLDFCNSLASGNSCFIAHRMLPTQQHRVCFCVGWDFGYFIQVLHHILLLFSLFEQCTRLLRLETECYQLLLMVYPLGNSLKHVQIQTQMIKGIELRQYPGVDQKFHQGKFIIIGMVFSSSARRGCRVVSKIIRTRLSAFFTVVNGCSIIFYIFLMGGGDSVVWWISFSSWIIGTNDFIFVLIYIKIKRQHVRIKEDMTKRISKESDHLKIRLRESCLTTGSYNM